MRLLKNQYITNQEDMMPRTHYYISQPPPFHVSCMAVRVTVVVLTLLIMAEFSEAKQKYTIVGSYTYRGENYFNEAAIKNLACQPGKCSGDQMCAIDNISASGGQIGEAGESTWNILCFSTGSGAGPKTTGPLYVNAGKKCKDKCSKACGKKRCTSSCNSAKKMRRTKRSVTVCIKVCKQKIFYKCKKVVSAVSA